MLDLLPEICDRYDNRISVLQPMFQSFGAKTAFWGEVITLKAFEDNSKVRELAAQDGTGKVLVVDSGGSKNRAMLGDMLAEKAASNGWQGIIINGCVRDVNALSTIELGIHAIAAHPLKTDKRGLGDINVPLHIGGVEIVAGDFIYADNNGVVVSKTPLDLAALE
ncbi:putative 4-hydroxy-4-methyl-2-oxoglutarate aldolase [Psychrobium sp. nBUS_13]|uniref:putative 4-hydroxy-4-methyl-2-oxoglutarate aldolase n=1 Tax=Psychrobium sp. nBUS_13 TaxID=3395319 RepID=UPI003EBDCD09